jgi:hypothetical protein
MTHIKKLFLTLSLLAVHATFSMDVPQAIKSPDGQTGWVQITRNADLGRFVEKCVVANANPDLIRPSLDQYLYISPKQPALDSFLDPNLYPVCLFQKKLVRGYLLKWDAVYYSRFENTIFQDDKHPFLVRLLTIEEACDLATAVKRNEFHVSKSARDDREALLDAASLRLDCLTPHERKKYLIQQKMYFDRTTLLGVRRFRKSIISVLPTDVVRYMCQLPITGNPVLKFE